MSTDITVASAGFLQVAESIKNTDLIPKSLQGNAEAIMATMLYGQEVGLGAMQSLNGVAVINGKTSLYGDVYKGIILSHPDFAGMEESWESVKSDAGEEIDLICHVKMSRAHQNGKYLSTVTGSFGISDQIRAGLNSPVWKKFPKDMLYNRAFNRAAKKLFSDATAGMSSESEAQDIQPMYRAEDVKPEAAVQPSQGGTTKQDVTNILELINACESREELTGYWKTLNKAQQKLVVKQVQEKATELKAKEAETIVEGEVVVEEEAKQSN